MVVTAILSLELLPQLRVPIYKLVFFVIRRFRPLLEVHVCPQTFRRKNDNAIPFSVFDF